MTSYYQCECGTVLGVSENRKLPRYCPTCSRPIKAERQDESQHISGAVYPAIETAYGRTVDHGFNVKIF